MKTFGITYDKEHEYCFYIGIDRGDKVYDRPEVRLYLDRFASIMRNTRIEFVYMDGITKGHLTVMWNRLFDKAYLDGNDFFFQCGDDISFESSGWVNSCIAELEKTRGVGMAGPLNNNGRILTQVMVSRRHMDIFGYFFPEEIINWCCDDWYNWVYKPDYFFPLKKHYCSNEGGNPRYDINNNSSFMKNYKYNVEKIRKSSRELAESHKYKLIKI
jgi:hypothetical protein